MLIRMVVRPAGEVAKGIPGTVVAAKPAVNTLTVSFIFTSGERNAVFLSEENKG